MGFLMLLAQFALLSYYDYSFYAADNTHPDYPLLPRRVWIMSAFFMFAAHTLGNFTISSANDLCYCHMMMKYILITD